MIDYPERKRVRIFGPKGDTYCTLIGFIAENNTTVAIIEDDNGRFGICFLDSIQVIPSQRTGRKD